MLIGTGTGFSSVRNKKDREKLISLSGCKQLTKIWKAQIRLHVIHSPLLIRTRRQHIRTRSGMLHRQAANSLVYWLFYVACAVILESLKGCHKVIVAHVCRQLLCNDIIAESSSA